MGSIRFVLALSVLIVHAGPVFGVTLLPGYLAVQLFYVISGFYMALIYNEKYVSTISPKYLFYTNRLLRIYPLYFLVILMILGLSIVLGLWVGSFGKLQYYIDAYRANRASLFTLGTIGISNITLIGQDILSFFGFSGTGGLNFLGFQQDMKFQEYLFIPIAWTVSVELFFYALSPFVVSRNTYHILLWILVVLLLRLSLFVFFDARDGFDVYRFAPTELFWFLLGVLSYRLSILNYLPSARYGSFLWVVILLLIVLYNLYRTDWIIFALVVICTPSIFRSISSSYWDRYLGELTYPLYISHMFFIMIVTANAFPKQFGTGLPVLVLTLVFSILCHHFFEKWIQKFRQSRVR